MTRRSARPLLLALLALPASLALSGSARAATPPVVAPSWLAERLDAVSVVDARGSVKTYLAGHVPGAQPLLVENLRSTSGGVVGTLLPPETIALLAGRLGLETKRPVVVYSEASDVDATYVATALRIAGFDEVAVLDGGFARWSAEGRPVTAERTRRETTRPKPAARPKLLVPFEEVKAAVEKKSAVLLDVRPAEQFAAGHLPGAKNRVWTKDVADGSFRPEAEIAAELAALGITKETPVIVYCNTGHMASEGFYTLRFRLGFPDVRLYNGSWLEWTMHPGAPREP